jgi:hypothetical protein
MSEVVGQKMCFYDAPFKSREMGTVGEPLRPVTTRRETSYKWTAERDERRKNILGLTLLVVRA